MHIYVDLDCYVKLCACGLWPDTMKLFGVGYQDVFVANTFTYSCERQAKKQAKKCKVLGDVYKKAAVDLRSFQQLSALTDSDVAEKIIVNNIDDGEAILVANAVNDPDGLFLMTGDKRFLQAMVTFSDEPLLNSLHKRMIHLNHLLYAFCKNMDYEELKKRMTRDEAQASDNVVKIAFHTGSTISSSTEALIGYCNDIDSLFCMSMEEVENLIKESFS